jgi:hypothetical protein
VPPSVPYRRTARTADDIERQARSRLAAIAFDFEPHQEAQLATLPPGLQRDHIVRRVRQNEIATHIAEWLKRRACDRLKK